MKLFFFYNAMLSTMILKILKGTVLQKASEAQNFANFGQKSDKKPLLILLRLTLVFIQSDSVFIKNDLAF